MMNEKAKADTRLLIQITLGNFLSFGPQSPSLFLENLNILIGPNGVGKSNLIEAVALLRATPIPPQTTFNADVRVVLRRGGSAADLAETYEKIRIYRDWQFGRKAIFREPQRADMRSDRLEEDFSNLGLFLSQLGNSPRVKKEILDRLADFYDGITDFQVTPKGGTVEVFFHEGDFAIPATRLSDGTLRYLCLLAILCDPTPPPLICIEEPELGLHPDIIPKMADLLVSASERTQLIVTTHSDILVDAMTERPEVVVVCEKHDGQTQMKRLDKNDLAVWLEKYRLGQLWTKGMLGGNRW